MPTLKQRKWKIDASSKESIIALFAVTAIGLHLLLRFGVATVEKYHGLPLYNLPLIAVLVFGGIPLVIELLIKLGRLDFGSDLLAGISIITAAFLGEYLAGAIVVLMLSGGEALEAYAVRRRLVGTRCIGPAYADHGSSQT